jgi:hypothetical protein
MRAGVAVSCALAALLLVVLRSPSLAREPGPQPQLCRLVVEARDADGHELLARVRIAPSSFGARHALGLTRDLVQLTEGGGAAFELAAGDYTVFVSHGPEWSIAELAVRALPGQELVRSVTLEHEVQLPGWHGAELHVHTERSSDAAEHGGVSARALLAEGVGVAVATDHNQIGALADAIESAAGAEITTWAPEVGHFNAFPLQALPRWRGTNPRRLMHELTRDPRVFVQVNHPRLDDHIAYFVLGGFDGGQFAQPDYHLHVHGLEVWNGYDLAQPGRVRTLLGEWRRWIARGHSLTATGGSDSHGAPGHLPGYPRTYTPAARGDELAPALRAGRAFVTNGPLLALNVEGRAPGEQLTWTRSDRPLSITLHLTAASWLRVETLELWADDELVWRASVPAPPAGAALDHRVALQLQLASARALTAVAHGGSGLDRLLGRGDVEPLAFTNPVYLSHPR